MSQERAYARPSARAMLLLATLHALLACSPNGDTVVEAFNLNLPGWDLFEELFLNTVPRILGQRPNNENGSASEFKEFLETTPDDSTYNLMTLVSICALELSCSVHTCFWAICAKSGTKRGKRVSFEQVPI